MILLAFPAQTLRIAVPYLLAAAGGVMSDDMIDAYIELRMAENMRYEMAPHPIEYDMYYSV